METVCVVLRKFRVSWLTFSSRGLGLKAWSGRAEFGDECYVWRVQGKLGKGQSNCSRAGDPSFGEKLD